MTENKALTPKVEKRSSDPMLWEIKCTWTLIYTTVWMTGTRYFSLRKLEREERVKRLEDPWKRVGV